MSVASLHSNNVIVPDIRDCCDGLVSMRADYVQAFASGEDGPFMRQELAQLQSIIMAFDAVIEETGGLGALAEAGGGRFSAIDGVEFVAALRQQGRI